MPHGFEPSSRGIEILHAETLRQFDAFVVLRQDRLHRITACLPAVVWYVLVLGAIITQAIAWCLSVETASIHLLFTGALAWLLGLLVFLIASLDHPFRGKTGISPTAFEQVYRDVMGVRETPGRPSNRDI